MIQFLTRQGAIAQQAVLDSLLRRSPVLAALAILKNEN